MILFGSFDAYTYLYVPTILVRTSDEITLSSNSLTGEIPSEIGLLNKLTDLSLHMNQLSGTIPTSFGLLDSLNWMYLNENNLVGTIPSEIPLLRTSLSMFSLLVV